ncbi:MAG: FIST C-terminal domain-containing protein [Treponema sp.]|nr:FIST C-terminal domain-containing protein [Treponema sp.]
MIKVLTAVTEEIDDADEAVNEILNQLDLNNNLAANSVGLITCALEFIHSGVLEALSRKLPFCTVGITTQVSAENGIFSPMLLAISVLTADDVVFSVEHSGTITSENVNETISSAFKKARSKLTGDPCLVLAYPPIIMSIGSYPIVNAIFKEAGDTPVFGTLACSANPDNSNSFTIVNGKAESMSAAFVLMSGNVHPNFFMVSIPEQNLQRQYGVITESDGCRVCKVNGMSFVDFLKKRGFSDADINANTLYLIPFVLNFGDGSRPIVRALYSIDDDGAAIFGDEMPKGKAISTGSLNYNGIIETTEELMRQIPSQKDINGILIYSCLVRHILLGIKDDDELKKIIEMLGETAPYQVCYSGGEICPVKDSDGKFINRMHNYTLVACVL